MAAADLPGEVRVLIIGGTWFLGRVIAEQAVARGWQVTTFNRGRTGTDVPGVATIHGDRTKPADVSRLAEHGEWDAVVDTSGQEPLFVGLTANALRDLAARYLFVSTVNVYQGWPTTPLDDSSPLRASRPDLAFPDVEHLPRVEQYGALKAGCEPAVHEHTERDLLDAWAATQESATRHR